MRKIREQDSRPAFRAEKKAIKAAETQSGQKNTVIGEKEIVFGALARLIDQVYMVKKDPAAEEERIKDLLRAAETDAGGAVERKSDANTQLQTVASQIKDLDETILEKCGHPSAA